MSLRKRATTLADIVLCPVAVMAQGLLQVLGVWHGAQHEDIQGLQQIPLL